MHRNPRTALGTHDVTNQPPPLEDVNLFAADAILQSAVAWSGAGVHRARLDAFGARVGAAETQERRRQANAHPPVFRPFDRYGRRIDEVEFHPAYHELMALGLGAGVSGAAWNVASNGHALHAALLFLMGQADHGVCCPMSMTYAVVPALRIEPGVAKEWVPRATSETYDPRFVPAGEKRGATLGMAMTEKQGGSDVRANTTRAFRDADGAYRLVGHKWFCSAPMSDAFLTLAYVDGAMTCFLVPRWRPDGERNGFEIQRLKDKLGDRSNASSEIEYRDAYALRVGEEGRGIRTIIEMVQLARLDCVIGAASQMREAASLALWHAAGRSAFQRRLIDQPLMRAVLADLALDVEAAVALAFRLAQALDRAGSDPREAALARIGLPLAKYLTTKRAPTVVVEAMECHGGAGYVEESPLPRLFRQSPLNAIWEGSGNVIALDTLRALGREKESAAALLHELGSAAKAEPAMRPVLQEAEGLLGSAAGETAARGLSERLALAFAAAVLVQTAPGEIARAFIDGRIASQSLTFGARPSAATDALVARATLQA
ncbi:MAG: acyl-CoA dehydrogenase family protein [Parvularculaceae bacterium]|nr:acyl-CoA dehydrogenase family protein [Parvularculaceae bacterium]